MAAVLGSLLLRLLNPFRLIFAAIGIGLIIGGNVEKRSQETFKASGIPATGVVTALNSEEDSDGDTMYYPVVRFVTRDGTWVTITSKEGSRPAAYKVGEYCPVYYDRQNPQDAMIDSPMHRWFPIILWAMGALFVVCALFGKPTPP